MAARKLDLDIEWSGKGVDEKAVNENGETVVAIDPRYFRPAEVEALLGDPSKAKAMLGWSARVSFEQLVEEMATEDLKSAQRDELVKSHGHRPYDYNE
jgi:GDPmannose 4,6-dehydratase